MPRGFFRVMSLLKSPTKRNTEKVSFVTAVKWAFLFKHYRSQWRTWLGLLPEAITKIILLRSAHIQAASVSRIFNRPHQGLLLYETKFGIAYEDFKKEVLNKRFKIFDMRNIYSPTKMKKMKIRYFGVGR